MRQGFTRVVYYSVIDTRPVACSNTNRASSRENLSSGFPTKRVSNQSPQLQRLARKMKFRL